MRTINSLCILPEVDIIYKYTAGGEVYIVMIIICNASVDIYYVYIHTPKQLLYVELLRHHVCTYNMPRVYRGNIWSYNT